MKLSVAQIYGIIRRTRLNKADLAEVLLLARELKWRTSAANRAILNAKRAGNVRKEIHHLNELSIVVSAARKLRDVTHDMDALQEAYIALHWCCDPIRSRHLKPVDVVAATA